jgi:hypothetical protein
MRAGSMPRDTAFARVQRIAVFTSSIIAGHAAGPSSRYWEAIAR